MKNHPSYQLAGVMGWPVAHSRSPLIHKHWIVQYHLQGDYVLLPVAPDNLKKALRALPLLGFKGCNLTIPHKEQALAVFDEVDAIAKRVGAANTIVVGDSGALRGYNTDVFGFIEALRTAQNGKKIAGPCVVIGAGGACRAVLVALLDEGIKEIRLINRTYERAKNLADEFGSAIQPVKWSERSGALAACSLLVNTSSLGMQGQEPLDIDLSDLSLMSLVYDIIFVPWETQLIKDAKARGNQVLNGIPMLIHQARSGFNFWFGVMPDYSLDLLEKLKLSVYGV